MSQIGESVLKTCLVSGASFDVAPEDQAFYAKIGLPWPNLCPQERNRRRMSWRNERSLYHGTCAATGDKIITCFSSESGITAYSRDYWWSDQWDPLDYGQDYDWQRNFFSQFKDLLNRVPMPAVFNTKCVNSPYGNHIGEMKNCYLCFASFQCEDMMFSAQVADCKNSLDLLSSHHCEYCYELINCQNCHRTHYSQNSTSCTDSWFLFDCRGCTNCFGCVNLRNKSYYIWNEPYSKEDYHTKLAEMALGSRANIEQLKQQFDEFRLQFPHRPYYFTNVTNSTGDFLTSVDSSQECFYVWNEVQNTKWCINAASHMTDTYDAYGAGYHLDLSCEIIDSGAQASRLFATIVSHGSRNMHYTINCHDCSNCFGCIGLRKREYCIFNRQYTKDEYEELLPKIIEHMNTVMYRDSLGRAYGYGEFFPTELSPFAYNETIAQEHFPLTEQEVTAQSWRWQDHERSSYRSTMTTDDIPDTYIEISPSITQEVLACADAHEAYSPGAFKITDQELQFYERMNLPLPKYSPDARHFRRFKRRNPMQLWQRTTEDGQRVFTSYAPNRPERILSEEGYQREVL